MKSSPNHLWVEDESQRIGALNIPHVIWQQMRASPLYFLDIPFNERLDYILKDYGKQDIEKLMQATERIQKRLGPLETSTTLYLLKENKIKEAFAILLQYYDKLYRKSLHNRDDVNAVLHTLSLPGLSRDEKVCILINGLNQNAVSENSAQFTA
jgi:tRNA 2-selenouridine synthase